MALWARSNWYKGQACPGAHVEHGLMGSSHVCWPHSAVGRFPAGLQLRGLHVSVYSAVPCRVVPRTHIHYWNTRKRYSGRIHNAQPPGQKFAPEIVCVAVWVASWPLPLPVSFISWAENMFSILLILYSSSRCKCIYRYVRRLKFIVRFVSKPIYLSFSNWLLTHTYTHTCTPDHIYTRRNPHLISFTAAFPGIEFIVEAIITTRASLQIMHLLIFHLLMLIIIVIMLLTMMMLLIA